MEKHFRKGNRGRSPMRRGKRWLALLLSLCLIGTMIPLSARAEEEGMAQQKCQHHTEHTADCGYAESVEGQACEHTHDDGCGYQEANDCTHVHTEECGENGENCTHVHDDACGYMEGHACGHVHDESCAYVERVEGSPCTFVCDTCQAESDAGEDGESALATAVQAVQALIDALPAAEDITEENMEAVSGKLDEIDTAKEALTDEEREAVDLTKYDEAVAKMMELMGQAGAGNVAVMALSGFTMTGKPADTTVRRINLNAAVLRPDSTWSTDDKLVYFGSYDGNPVAYRVLSSPSTQEDSKNYLLLDCDTILTTMEFSDDNNTNQWTNEHCTIRNWLNGTNFYEGTVFSSLEKTAIAKTVLKEQTGYTAGSNNINYEDYPETNYVFCLSAAEADGLYASNCRCKEGFEKYWWLRSASPNDTYVLAGFMNNGLFYQSEVQGEDACRIGVSPALNLNLSSILFTSDTEWGKSSTLSPVSESTAKEWRLTLLDSSKTVKVTEGQSVTRQGTTITVPYTYEDRNTANPVSQISVMITDKAYTESGAQILYYGKLQTTLTSGGASGTGTFTLPSDQAEQIYGTNYFAYIVAEAVNGNTETDYASIPAEISIPDASGSDPVTPDTPASPIKGKGLGVSIIADPTAPTDTNEAWKGNFVYFGTYDGNPVKYRVLDRTTTDFGSTTMLLDCNSILWTGTNSNNQSSKFDDKSNAWTDSEIKKYLNNIFFTNNFTVWEQAAIAESSKANAGITDGNGWSWLKYTALSGERIFLLDAKEVTNTSYGYSNTEKSAANRKKTDVKKSWWLRSANPVESEAAGVVDGDCMIGNHTVSYDNATGVSPALNVNLSSVIFSSVLSGASGQPGAEYKLTLHDGNMTITPGTVTRNSGDAVTVPYSIGGTNGGNATQVSLMVLDKEYTAGNTNGAKLVDYEELADAGSTSGTFTLTDDMKNGSYYYYIVAEDINDGNATDYASEPVHITIPDAGADNPGGDSSDNPGNGGSDNKAAPDNPNTAYRIIDGANSSWMAGSSEGLTFRGDGAFSKFIGVKVDGKLLDQSNYTVKEGSTIITLKASYLNTLSAGTHTVEILWTDGSASTTFTINANTSGKKDDVPKTGESTPAAWPLILVVLSGTGLLLTGKKGKKNLETLRK